MNFMFIVCTESIKTHLVKRTLNSDTHTICCGNRTVFIYGGGIPATLHVAGSRGKARMCSSWSYYPEQKWRCQERSRHSRPQFLHTGHETWCSWLGKNMRQAKFFLHTPGLHPWHTHVGVKYFMLGWYGHFYTAHFPQQPIEMAHPRNSCILRDF